MMSTASAKAACSLLALSDTACPFGCVPHLGLIACGSRSIAVAISKACDRGSRLSPTVTISRRCVIEYRTGAAKCSIVQRDNTQPVGIEAGRTTLDVGRNDHPLNHLGQDGSAGVKLHRIPLTSH